MEPAGQQRQPQEHGAEGRAHDDEGRAGVAPLRWAEGGDAVGDGLHPRHRGAARGEGVEGDPQRGPEEEAAARRAEVQRPGLLCTGGGQVTEGHPCHPDDQEHGHGGDEEVGGDGEHAPGLTDAPEVAEGDEDDEEHRYGHRVGLENGERRREGGRPGGDRHRDGQHVVGQEGHAGQLGGHEAEVVPGDHVGPARGGIGLDRLPVGQDEQGQDHEHCQGQRDDQGEGGDADGGHQHPQDLLGGVRRGRQVVGGEDGESGRLAEAFVDELVGAERRAQQMALEAVRPDLGDVADRRGGKRCGPHRRVGRLQQGHRWCSTARRVRSTLEVTPSFR
jgi:hypothetical protein